MTKLKRTEDGGYIIKGKKYETLRGTRRQVHEYETAYKTAGGLLKEDLVQNSKGRIVSKAKFDDGPNLLKNLTKRGFFTKKGKFGHTKMKTRKLRKKLTQKNKRKMKGGESIQGIKDKLELVKNMIPKQIEKIETSSEYKTALKLDQTGNAESMFKDKLFKPLLVLNDKIKEPITQVETAIGTFEGQAKSEVESGKETLKGVVEAQFETLDNLIDNEFEKIKKIAKKALDPTGLMLDTIFNGTPAGIALYTAKKTIKTVVSSKKDEILKTIDAINLDALVEGATTGSLPPTSKTNSNSSSQQPPPPPEENKTASETSSSSPEVVEAQEKIEQKLSPDDQDKFEKEMEICKTNALNKFADEKNRAELAAAGFANASIGASIGGKKKSKGKK